MNISNQVQMIFIPWWIRILVAVLVLVYVGLAGYLLHGGLIAGDKPDWFAAGTQLLGVGFPILLVAIVIAGASFGERSIIRRTEKMLVRTIPYHLQFIPEETRRFADFRSHSRPPMTAQRELAQVSLFMSRGRCCADYILKVPNNDAYLTLNLRVELNVKRANINVAFLRSHLDQLMAGEQFDGCYGDFLRGKFSHSLAIEALQAREHSTGEDRSTIAYAFNSEFLSRTVDGQDYVVVVASTGVSYDTVWNPSERVFFAQDLMFMIRAFMQECPEIFE
ncbi:hypothetical protein [Puniceibacterium sp. IMCC21224]|uniref:hypothetical protein n=1 Tax=Puniceibacterium sp. IMCC21224 TaxID=1618204 RepID=UPI00064DA932|nr:hypothetical protein [Puniceibacterium sp. IMCC21224]KMK65620.1 hypothetical protein IMCC21224_11452 [Puniceibacterium sp. IMCC21224]